MATEENFCLRLTELGSNIRASWQQLQIDKDFCDVTLACNDGKIQGHRIILSHSSTVLKDILKQNANANPFIYIRGVKYKSLESLIQFMYQGEVTISDEYLINFLEVVEDLKVTGLSSENRDSVIPSYELSEDEGLSNNQNEELQSTSNIHDEKVQQDSRESLFQGKRKRPKSTKLTTDDSIVIDNFRRKYLKEENNSNRETHSEYNNKIVELNTINNEYYRERRPKSKHEDIGLSSKRKRMATDNQVTNIIENHSVGLLTKFENFFNNEDSNFLLQEPKTIRLDMAEDLKIPRLLLENGESVTPSDELQGNMDAVLPINQNEELHSNIHDEKVQKDSWESSFQRYQNKSAKLTSDDSTVIDNYRINNLKDLKEKDNQDISDLRHTKINPKKLVSVNNRRFSCDKCDKHYTVPSNLRKHKSSAHEGVRYPCNECNAGPFTLSDNLMRHKVSAHEGVRYPCDQCNAGPFNYPGDLRTHKASAHEGVRYPCDECNAGPFSKASNLWNHKTSVHKGVQYPCDECNAGPFTKSSKLRRHKASVHEGVRYTCDECNAGPFINLYSLRTHKASEHERVRYHCDECNAGPFTKSGSLRKHKASVHEGVRYPCDECNAGPYTQSGELRKHKASAHEGVRYECNTCDYKATTKGNLKKHCIRIHKF